MQFYIIIGLLLTLISCTAIKEDQNKSKLMTDQLDKYLLEEKVINANYHFNNLKDYQTDPIFTKALNDYYGSFPKAISVGHRFKSFDFSRNHFFIRHLIDTELYKGDLVINNKFKLKQALLKEQCIGFFANSIAIKKNGGMGITKTYYFIKENKRVVVDMNTLECKR